MKSIKLGAISGDILGSFYERHNIKYKLTDEQLLSGKCRFTDDSVMTIAVAKGISNAISTIPQNWYGIEEYEDIIYHEIQESMQFFGRKYPNAGYGGNFYMWLYNKAPKPYGSCGNGSAMRVSYAGWFAKSLKEAERLAEISAKITHNHEDGINGAVAVAASIYILRSGGSKEDVRNYVSKIYNIDFTLDEIRDYYRWGVLCSNSVPQAIVAFLEGQSFSEVISNAISIGGDSDTIAAIAGSIAEVIYEIPESILNKVLNVLDEYLITTLGSIETSCKEYLK